MATLACWGLLIALALGGGVAQAPGATSSVTASLADLSPEDLELARYLDVLEGFELLQDLELMELMPVLEEEDDD